MPISAARDYIGHIDTSTAIDMSSGKLVSTATGYKVLAASGQDLGEFTTNASREDWRLFEGADRQFVGQISINVNPERLTLFCCDMRRINQELFYGSLEECLVFAARVIEGRCVVYGVVESVGDPVRAMSGSQWRYYQGRMFRQVKVKGLNPGECYTVATAQFFRVGQRVIVKQDKYNGSLCLCPLKTSSQP